ncbi:unnamed protein product [Fusarium graminearum]|uniref:Chromosome 1, complete genome n=1 Tax=Gibberella zeae (strain ATCC MYA-4620 / CBS 123657 / FGSC 9075 / NRRL 31084 / PH-1) TaxID=229533 RepID=A0A0E0RSR6_GIBZE|nr:hypothetical protein FG05_35334 [Fusarium graminearum]CEF74291.1 unnamed protein product [Fusarium graminearum]
MSDDNRFTKVRKSKKMSGLSRMNGTFTKGIY